MLHAQTGNRRLRQQGLHVIHLLVRGKGEGQKVSLRVALTVFHLDQGDLRRRGLLSGRSQITAKGNRLQDHRRLGLPTLSAEPGAALQIRR